MILRARVVWPMLQPAIADGGVVIKGNHVVAVGPWRQLSRQHSGGSLDLGEVVLMPGLVNSHCHLDYTHMAGQFPPPRQFIDWLKLITTTKAQWTSADYRASWLSGAEMLIKTGTTTVGDIEAVPELLPDLWASTPLRVISFLEMIGITKRRPPEEVLREALRRTTTLQHSRCRVGLSPHAPYSTVPRLLQETSAVARARGWLVCTHVAESKPEFTMFTQGRGDMFDWLQRSGRDMSDCGSGSPVQHLERCKMLRPNLVVAHANYLSRGDAARLAKHQVSVVHCPRSHAYFGHEPFPLRRLLRAGVNVCLGTDSLASVPKRPRQSIQLDMFAELRTLASAQPWLSAKRILRMATVNGSRALGEGSRLGCLRPGGAADLIALPLKARLSQLPDAILEHQGPVCASMIAGQWVLSPP